MRLTASYSSTTKSLPATSLPSWTRSRSEATRIDQWTHEGGPMTTASTATIQPKFQTIDGLAIRYADTGVAEGKPTVLLTSPWPESVYAFASVWATLAEHVRLFAIDLPGFGASERRAD